MKFRIFVCGLLLLLPTAAVAQTGRQYLNYFAVGQGRITNAGAVVDGWATTLLVFNADPAETKFTIKVFDVTGKPLTVTLRQTGPLLTNSQFEVPLKGNGSAVLNLVSDGALKVGYLAWDETPAQSTISLVLTFFRNSRAVTFAGVQSSGPVKKFTYVHTITDNQNTGVAILNPGTQDVTVTGIAYDPLGNIQLLGGIRSLAVKAGQVVSQFTTEFFPSLFDPKGLLTGKIIITSPEPILPLVLLTKQDLGGDFQISTLAMPSK